MTSGALTVIMCKETAEGGLIMRKGDDARRELMRRAAELFDGRGYDAV